MRKNIWIIVLLLLFVIDYIYTHNISYTIAIFLVLALVFRIFPIRKA